MRNLGSAFQEFPLTRCLALATDFTCLFPNLSSRTCLWLLHRSGAGRMFRAGRALGWLVLTARLLLCQPQLLHFLLRSGFGDECLGLIPPRSARPKSPSVPIFIFCKGTYMLFSSQYFGFLMQQKAEFSKPLSQHCFPAALEYFLSVFCTIQFFTCIPLSISLMPECKTAFDLLLALLSSYRWQFHKLFCRGRSHRVAHPL